MIEINAVAGEARKDGASVQRPQSPTAFRSFLESLGGASKAAEAAEPRVEAAKPAPRELPEPRAKESFASRPEGAASMREATPAAKNGESRIPTAKADRNRSIPESAESSERGQARADKAQTTDAVDAEVSREAKPLSSDEVASVEEVEEIDPKKRADDWQDVVAKTLGLLGICVDPAKLQGLTGQELRELDVALRAGLKGLTEGQPVAQVAKLVGELLPVPLQSVLPEPSQAQPVASFAAMTKDAASIPGPVREHKTQEIGRLAEKMTELVRPTLEPLKSETVTAAPLKPEAMAELPTQLGAVQAEEQPVLPVAAAKEGARTENATVPALPKLPEAAKPRTEDPSAFLRLDPAGFQIQRTDLQESAKAEAKAPLFRPSGPAGEMLAHQVYDEFQLRPGMDHREMVLKLWPRELGQVSVHIKMAENERVEAKILVQNENIRQALIEHTPVLRETLAKQGLELGSLSVSVGGGEGQSFGNPSGREGSSRRRGGHSWEDGVLETSVRVDAGTDTGRRNGFNSIDVLT